MLWLLVIHIAAVLFWCASLLYLPALIAGTSAGRTHIDPTPKRHDSAARFVFTHIATPAALLAIVAGSVVFLLNRTTDGWLIAKLTLVSGLVIAHSLIGLLVMRAEEEEGKRVVPWCWVLAISVCVLTLAIVWTVLAKPVLEITSWAG
ncbi:MAG: CopD family protein [Gammaproteobacteria bacterium]|nr:CopD family protein [Gammaproteobacteria bacterium]